jgi:arylsulfatase A
LIVIVNLRLAMKSRPHKDSADQSMKTITLLCSVLVLFLADHSHAASDQRPPNIIHIIADDLGYDDLSCFGAPKIKTPNLDQLAKEGVRFTSFYAPHSTCTPSRAAILTGRIAARIPPVDHILSPKSETGLDPMKELSIATLLKQRDYTTALIGKWHLGHLPQFSPVRNGFDLFLGIPYPNDHDPIRPNYSYAPPIPLLRGTNIIEQPAKLATLPERFCEEAIKFITENKDRSFFIHYANIETHTPWFVPKRFEGKSADGAFGDAVECLDWQVGQILAVLKKLGLETNTLIFFSSDNGPLVHRYPELETAYGKFAAVETNRPHVLREGKYQSRYEGGPRVAAIARWPGRIPGGKVRDEIVAGYDLFTTFAKLAGAKIPSDRVIDGKDLSPLLFGAGDAKPLRDAFFAFQGQRLAGVRWKNWKLVLPLANEANAAPQLLDLATDLGEKNNVAKDHEDVVKEITALADRARKAVKQGRPLE